MPRKPSRPKCFKWEDQLFEFLLFKQADGRAPRTLKDYEKHITRFFHSFPEAAGTYDNLRHCVFTYLSEPIAPATRNLRLTNLRSFFRWCVEQGYLPADPTQGLKKSRTVDEVRHVSMQDIQTLLAQPKKTSYTGLRDYCMMLMQLDTAIRPGEMLQLNVEDVNLKIREVYVRPAVAKTRMARTLPISPFLAQVLERFLKVRPEYWGPNVPLFASEGGRPLTAHWWTKKFKSYAKQAGVSITPYSLRHTAAIELLRGGADAFSVQKFLGHTDLRTTRRYINLTQNDLKEVHALASPLQRFITLNKRAPRKLK